MGCKWSSRILVLALSALSFFACEELLPPRADPSNILRASLTPPHEVIAMEDEIPIRGAGSYVVSLANTYDEVLQKKMDVRGTVTVWLEKDPAVRRTIPLTVLQLAYPVPSGDQLTILPGDSARLLVWWDQRTDGGEPFWSGTRLTEFVTPSGVYLDSEPIEFVAQASIQLFENVQPRTTSPIHYTSMYRLFGSTGGND